MPPTMLINSLQSVRRRVKVLGVVYGTGIVLAAAVGLLLAISALDYVLNLPPTPRLVAILLAAGAIVYALWRWIARPLAARLSISDVAGRLEQAFPQFDDRLRSTVDFLRGDVPGSEPMKQRVISETAALAGQLDLARAVVATPAWYSMSAGIGAILLAGMLALLAPDYSSIALRRIVSPFGDAAWPKRVQISMLGQVPTRVPVGQRIELRMRLQRGDSASRRASIFYQYDGGAVQRELMLRGPDGSYSASLDARVESGKQAASLRVWMEAGDDRVELPPITVVPRLAIRSVEAVLTPPAYVTARPPQTVNLAAAPAIVADGSRVTIRVQFSKPLADPAQVELIPANDDTPAPQVAWQRQSSTAVAGEWLARQSLRFHIRATDTDGFTNNALEEYELIVRPDQHPSVQIENPRRNEERTAVSVVPLTGVVEDDYGIEWLKLVIERVGGEKKRWEINLLDNSAAVNGASSTRAESAADRLRLRVLYAWDLAQLQDANLKPGDVLEYHLLAKDNFVLDGQTHPPVPSGKLRIVIISQEELTSRVIDELRQAKNQIIGVRQAVDRTRQETSDLADETRQKEQLDAADRAALDRLTNQQATGASQTRQIASRIDQLRDRLAENKSPAQELADLARDVSSDLNRAAEEPMKEATRRLSEAAQPNAARQQRNDAINRAGEAQQQADQQLQQALDRLANIGTLQQTIDNLRRILEAQQQVSRDTREIGKRNLGKTPDQISPQDRQKLDEAADQQQKLADQTNKALEQMQNMAEQMQRSDESASQAMSRAAQTGRQQQVSQNQQRAAQQARQNQQAQAQAAQRQAEIGLEMMLNELREAERHKLAELQKKLEELQNQIANLIRRQAGHNIDNLSIQGPERLAKMEQTLLAELLIKAERDPQKPGPIPQIEQLSAAQEQTERNTRDLGKTTEAMPNGAGPASHLTRAAARMERAIVHLRDRKLPDAYEPPQVEALAELEQAKRDVDQQKNEVDEQIEQQDKESIRQRYVKIREQQQKLNEETTRIQNARGPDGALNRADAVRLGQLPGEQGKLADETNAISEDLSALSSTVYAWANKDIVESMKDVKDELGRQNTGVATQSEQARILEQLDAMIRNLAVKPRDSRFAQEDQGGGGGGGQSNGGPRLPAEAELRLLQDLQRAINRSTKAIDAQPPEQKQADKPKLIALGNRQGDLRQVLDEMLQKASQGQIKLGPEPDNRDQLPEEARTEDIENQELEKNLLNDVADEEKNAKQATLIGDRMARSRQRLALNNDPGRVTQLIQQRIIEDMDYLIDQARQQQAETRNAQQRQRGQAQRMAQARPGQQADQANQLGQRQQRAGQTPAQESTPPGPGGREADLARQIRESAAEWGAITPRLRDAVIEGSSETIIQDYRRLIEEYYRSVADRGTGQ
ncbi:DUF4175 family protein [Fontivita pretiosa]|uniref:DUF4175 family protein n=1 Tax=Fontivita pretiosa TaxID=2989684 RepID=UPI003D17C20F